MLPSIDFKLSDYLQLIDMTGRLFSEGKRGKIPDSCVDILDRLKLSSKGWFEMVRSLEKKFSFAIGDPTLLSIFPPIHQHRSPKGLSMAKKVYFGT